MFYSLYCGIVLSSSLLQSSLLIIVQSCAPITFSVSTNFPQLCCTCPIFQVDGVSLQGCSEQRATEVLRRTGPLVRLRLLRSALRLSPNLPPVPPLHPLRHSHSFSESSSHHSMGLKRIHKTGALRQEHVCPFDIWFWTIKKGIIWKACFELNYVMLLFESLNWFFFFFCPPRCVSPCSLKDLLTAWTLPACGAHQQMAETCFSKWYVPFLWAWLESVAKKLWMLTDREIIKP